MEALLKEQVKAAVDVDNVRNAIFLAERLYERQATDGNAILLAQCYVANRQDYRAVGVLKKRGNGLSVRGRLLLAQSLFKTNATEKAQECISNALKNNLADKYLRAEFHYLAGMILRKTCGTEAEALTQFAQALECNCFHWASAEELCNLGKSDEMTRYLQQVENRTETTQQQDMEVSETPLETALEQTRQSQNAERDDNEMVVDSTEGEIVPQCPSPGVACRRDASHVTPQSLVRPVFPGMVHANAANTGPMTRQSMRLRDNVANRRRSNDPVNPETPAGKIQRVDAPAGSFEGKAARISSSESVYYSADDNLSEACSADRRTSSITVEPDNSAQWSNSDDGEKQLRSLFRHMCHALYALNTYDHEAARQLFMGITNTPHGESAWVKCKMGCLHMQSVRYDMAKQMFLSAHALDPTHLEDMDVFSSLLYLTTDTARLSNLVQLAREMDSTAPETWCVTGNYYSLIKDHQRALDAFKRAIQLDPGHAYAYALCGHTYLEMHRADKAQEFFTEATNRNRYAPHGWFGRGLVLWGTQKFELASSDFKQAISINPHNSIFRLRYGISLAEVAKKESDPELCLKALEAFDMATKLDNRNKDALLYKGKLQYDMKDYKEARATLETAARKSHKDAEVHYYLGLACKRLGDTATATNALNTALDLNPNPFLRGNIRAALDRVCNPDDDELRKY